MRLRWHHLARTVTFAAVFTIGIAVLGAFGRVPHSLTDSVVLWFIRLAMFSGSAYLVFNGVSFRPVHVVLQRATNQYSWPSRQLGGRSI